MDVSTTTGGGDLLTGGMGGGGLLGGLLIGALLGNGGLLGNNRRDGLGDSAVLRNPPEQNQANMDLMASIGAVDKAVAVSTAAMEASQATQTIGITSQLNNTTASLASRIDGVKEAVSGNAMVLAQQLNQLDKTQTANAVTLMQQLNGLEKTVLQAQNDIEGTVTNDGDKTRALLVQQYEATLNRQLDAAQNEIAELRNDNRMALSTRGIEVTTTNNINQMQQQQQQQAQYSQLANMIWGLGQQIRSTNEAINVGSGTLTANPANTNTNIR
jgi:hypothetical protein